MPYRNYRNYRTRRLRTREIPMRDEGPARIADLDSDFTLSGKDQPQNPQSPNKRYSYSDFLDTANDWWNVFRNVVQGVGWTAVEGASGAAAYYSGQLAEYAKFVNDVYDAYRRGKAAYDDYARIRDDYQRAKDWADENLRPQDDPNQQGLEEGRPRTRSNVPDIDRTVPEREDVNETIYGPRDGYPNRIPRGSGDRSGEIQPRSRAQGAGSKSRKHDFTVRYEYDY